MILHGSWYYQITYSLLKLHTAETINLFEEGRNDWLRCRTYRTFYSTSFGTYLCENESGAESTWGHGMQNTIKMHVCLRWKDIEEKEIRRRDGSAFFGKFDSTLFFPSYRILFKFQHSFERDGVIILFFVKYFNPIPKPKAHHTCKKWP